MKIVLSKWLSNMIYHNIEIKVVWTSNYIFYYFGSPNIVINS